MSNFFWISYISLWVLVFPLLIMNLILYRQLGIMVMGTSRGVNQSGIPIGRELPKIPLKSIRNLKWSIENNYGTSTLVMFASTKCEECSKILPDLINLSNKTNVKMVLGVISEDIEDVRTYAQKHNVNFEVVQVTQEDGQELDIIATPFAYAIDGEGVVREKGLVNTYGHLEKYLKAVSNKVA
ncbi:redoxin domain-containing protein [Evansella clarkii]|uniref:redoxin domain-containing protein n=1 Tax=Evansella clarkii TaxID=79879 RepID=UPI00099798A5|nr:thioredoxin-like domain-containing protein [Evansella clarkii]